MIPNWVAGKAALDAADRARRGAHKPPASGGFNGVLSFIGIVLIVMGTFAETAERYQAGGFVASVLAIVAGIVSYHAAYRVRGGIGLIVGIGFAVLSAYALHVINAGSGGASLFWDIVVFLLIGLDQLSLKPCGGKGQ